MQLHFLDIQSCAYKFPVCIQGSFAGKAADFPQGQDPGSPSPRHGIIGIMEFLALHQKFWSLDDALSGTRTESQVVGAEKRKN